MAAGPDKQVVIQIDAGLLRKLIKVVLVLVLLAALAVAAFLLQSKVFSGGESGLETLEGPASSPFKIEYPRKWSPVTPAKLADQPGSPLAVIRRRDARGFLIVRKAKGRIKLNQQLKTRTASALKSKFSGFNELKTKFIYVKSGKALLINYAGQNRRQISGAKGKVNLGDLRNLVLVPAGDHYYTINTLTRTDDTAAIKQIDAMIRSFEAK